MWRGCMELLGQLGDCGGCGEEWRVHRIVGVISIIGATGDCRGTVMSEREGFVELRTYRES